MNKIDDTQFDQLLNSIMKAPVPPADLQQKLLMVPALAEAADLPGFALSEWIGLYAPTGVPQPIMARSIIRPKASQSTRLVEVQL